MKKFKIILLLLCFGYKMSYCQKNNSGTISDSIVLKCFESHIHYLVKEKRLKSNEVVFLNGSYFFSNIPLNVDSIVVKQLGNKEREILTSHKKQISIFEVFPAFEQEKIKIFVVMLSVKRKGKQYNMQNQSTGTFEIDYDCSTNKYFCKEISNRLGQ
jgi:hypothetical protein